MGEKVTTWSEAEKKTARLFRAFDKLCNDYHEAIEQKKEYISLDEIANVLKIAEYGKDIHIIGGEK